jgi:hypothetical protein
MLSFSVIVGLVCEPWVVIGFSIVHLGLLICVVIFFSLFFLIGLNYLINNNDIATLLPVLENYLYIL